MSKSPTAPAATAEPGADPFRETARRALHEERQLLGARIRFETDSAELLELARMAYARLPAHRFARGSARLRVILVKVPRVARARGRAPRAPPPVWPFAGGGLLAGAMGGSSFITVDAPRGAALVAVAEELLRHPYHARYELIEFAVYLLAARAQALAPLHAACVGRAGKAVLLVGPSGAGKSTLMLRCLEQGLEFIAEDSVLVQPRGLLATGVPAFLHLRADSLRFVESPRLRRALRRAPTIVRRSGVRKYEVDLRGGNFILAPAPLQLAAMVFLSAQPAGADALLTSLSARQARARLIAQQPYAAGQDSWPAFLSGIARIPAFELRRGASLREAVAAIEQLLPAAARSRLRTSALRPPR